MKEGGGLALKMLRMCSMKSEGKGRPISVGNIRSSSSKFCTCAARRGAGSGVGSGAGSGVCGALRRYVRCSVALGGVAGTHVSR